VAGDVVYVTGVVEKGAGMVQGQETKTSQGGDDIWVSQMQVSDGTVNWMQQVGTSGDEHVARNGGIVTDNDGNAIVFGDTTGSLYRDRAYSTSSNSDLFVMQLLKGN
jgi:hypothetical protein